MPFLDHKLVEYIATLPDNAKVRDGQSKWILRQVMGAVVPPSILHRPKKGFPIPAGAWLRTELRDFVRDTLLARDSACQKFFDPQAVEEIVRRQEKGKTSGYQEVWSLLVFEMWHRKFIESLSPAHVSTGSAGEVDVYAGRGA